MAKCIECGSENIEYGINEKGKRVSRCADCRTWQEPMLLTEWAEAMKVLPHSPRNPTGAYAAFLQLPLWLRVWFFVDLAFWFSLLVGLAIWSAR